MGWPILIGDFIQRLIATNVIDIYLRPIHPLQLLGEAMVEVFVRNQIGTDLSGTVHFDYWTGSKNAKACRHVEDFATINNKLYDYLGPRLGPNRWRGNITPHARWATGTVYSGPSTGTFGPLPGQRVVGTDGHLWEADPGGTSGGAEPDFAGNEGGSVADGPDTLVWNDRGPTPDVVPSRALYGTFMQIREYNSTNGAESLVRPLYQANWNAEQGLRLEPRDMLFITPSPDAFALFKPYSDYSVGDLVAINTGPEFGVELEGAVERIYGWDVEWSREDVERVTSLLTSADAVE